MSRTNSDKINGVTKNGIRLVRATALKKFIEDLNHLYRWFSHEEETPELRSKFLDSQRNLIILIMRLSLIENPTGDDIERAKQSAENLICETACIDAYLHETESIRKSGMYHGLFIVKTSNRCKKFAKETHEKVLQL